MHPSGARSRKSGQRHELAVLQMEAPHIRQLDDFAVVAGDEHASRLRRTGAPAALASGARPSASRLAVGSSSSSSCGESTLRARERDALLFAAGELLRRHRSDLAARPAQSIASSTFRRHCSRGTPRAFRPYAMLRRDAGVKQVGVLVHVHDARTPAVRIARQLRLLASNRSTPASAGSSPARMRSRVVLPLPLSPGQHIALPALDLQPETVEHAAPAESPQQPGQPEQDRAHFKPPSPCSSAMATLMPSATAISTMPKRDALREIALARLQRDGGGHVARQAVDIAADHDGAADLRDDAAERRSPPRR